MSLPTQHSVALSLLLEGQGALKRVMAQQPPDPRAGPVDVDEQRVSKEPCHPSSPIPPTSDIAAGGAWSNSQQLQQQQQQQQRQQQQQQEEEEKTEGDEKGLVPGSADVANGALSYSGQQQRQQQQQQQEEEGGAPDSAAAAPCRASASDPAVGTEPERSLSSTSQQQQLQQQKEHYQQQVGGSEEAPDSSAVAAPSSGVASGPAVGTVVPGRSVYRTSHQQEKEEKEEAPDSSSAATAASPAPAAAASSSAPASGPTVSTGPVRSLPGTPNQQQQQAAEEEEEEKEEETPDSATAAPSSVPSSGPAVGTGLGRSLSCTSQPQQQQQQKETPDPRLSRARSELPPAKRSAPPSMSESSIGSNGGGTAGSGDYVRGFKRLAAMIPGPLPLGPPPPAAAAAAAVAHGDRNSSGDLQRSAWNRLMAWRDAAATAATAAYDHGFKNGSGSGSLTSYGERTAIPPPSTTSSMLPTSSSTGSRLAQADDPRPRHDFGVAATSPPPSATAAATESTVAVGTGVNNISRAPYPLGAAEALDSRVRRSGSGQGRDAEGSYSPGSHPAGYVPGWSHSGVSSAMVGAVGGGLRPIAPALPTEAHQWGTQQWNAYFAATQAFGVAPNSAAAAFGGPQGFLSFPGRWGGGINHAGGGGPIENPGSMLSGAEGAEEEDEDSEDERVKVPLVPADIPPGRDLNSSPWCCGSGTREVGKAGEPALLCDTPQCKKWMCHACRTEKKRGNGCTMFVCCQCVVVLGGTCWCHR